MQIFSERQRFRQWWLWIILFVLPGIFLYGSYRQIILKIPFGNNPASDTMLLALSAVFILLWLLFFISRLDTEISDKGISVRLYPFQLKKRKIGWNEIEKVYVRKYSPLWEYGGWGYRFGLFGFGRALSVSGNMGIQIVFRNGKKLLIGTNDPEGAAVALRTFTG